MDGVERMFPQSQQAAARQFLAYLTNKPGQVKYSPAEVKSAFSGLDVNPAGNNLSVSGDSLGMQNVIGGESLNNLQVKGNNVVLNYNYDVQNSVDEFGQGRYGEMYKDNPIQDEGFYDGSHTNSKGSYEIAMYLLKKIYYE